MFCLRIPCYKLHKEGLFYHIFTSKYKCHFEMNSKKLNLKAKHNFKKNIHGYSSSFLPTYDPRYVGLKTY